ncbi:MULTISPECIES: recombination-associated protein RdgC [Xanthomonas]|uniref:recombination-associated protein RdgC n=1 Tax=Xanthomonas TaxID=338 RepID=UPI001884078C|nr:MULTISPECIES: recombination-associated protein RdgC [Xanthomonas]QOX05432.1 recombination-associated protein RdgC [Xanthomonas sp. WG16]QXF04429.1 recombination-associated protein RdgC [Xanthomonas citri pv. citri]
MHFSKAIVFSYPPGLDFTPLEAMLAELPFKPCEPSAMSSEGFVPPVYMDDAPFAYRTGELILIAVQTESRIVPPAVVDERLEAKVKEHEDKEGCRPGGRMRKRLKEEVVAELMARSFTVKKKAFALIDQERHFFVVNTSSRKTAETVVSHVRAAIGSFPAIPLSSPDLPASRMTEWLASGNLPELWTLGDECVLKGPDSASVRIKGVDLHSEEVAKHLEAGMKVSRLAASVGDDYEFVLDESLAVSKFSVLVETELPDGQDDMQAHVDAELLLFATYFRRLLDSLRGSFQLSVAT